MNFKVFFTLTLISSAFTSSTIKPRHYRVSELCNDHLNLQLLVTPMTVRVYQGTMTLISKCNQCSVLPNTSRCSSLSHIPVCGARFSKLLHYVEAVLGKNYRKVMAAPRHNYVLFGVQNSMGMVYQQEELTMNFKPRPKKVEKSKTQSESKNEGSEKKQQNVY